ncbi:two-partner secretion domain-containing protein, partial [Falsiroseomonas oryzae]|uniref:two-partner secretion domain-containing protein n=1 Tax=Falsiroseomonas oryzae TaxID=2766473 RepID=UPI0022EB113B
GLVRQALLATTALLPAALVAAMPAAAQAPAGGQVTAGSATISQSATTTQVNQSSARAVVDWQRFDVGRNHTVQFNQPSAQAWTLNRVNTPDPSTIAGRIQSNGGVAIVNQSGVIFAPGAQVNVGSLIASAAGISNQNFMAGRMVFDQPARPGARVENHGSITVAERGIATLVGPGVANSGTIRARLGRVALAGAETFTLDLAGDGLIALDVTGSVQRAPEGAVALVTNSGTIEAPGGSVLLTADAARGVIDTMMRNTGRISADADAGAAAGQVAIRGGAGGDVRVEAGTVSAAGAA